MSRTEKESREWVPRLGSRTGVAVEAVAFFMG